MSSASSRAQSGDVKFDNQANVTPWIIGGIAAVVLGLVWLLTRGK